NRLLHDVPGVWSIYHTIDSELSNPFESYQMLSYVDKQIPHIPISAKGLDKTDLYTISTTNWQPYTWSINNVALAEQLHTALAFWQGGQSEKAFKMWESVLIESMYLGASPGGFEQLLYQDAIRGELYRDFADPIGMASRTLVEGLFGIQPDALAEVLTIQPGFPEKWNHAALDIPDISIDFKRENKTDSYLIKNQFTAKMNLKLVVNASFDGIEDITVNGKSITWKNIPESIGNPKIAIEVPYETSYDVKINWKGDVLENIQSIASLTAGESFGIKTAKAEIVSVYDPQSILNEISKTNKSFQAIAYGNKAKTFFIQLKQGDVIWWQSVEVDLKSKIESEIIQLKNNNVEIALKNNSESKIEGNIFFDASAKDNQQKISLGTNQKESLVIPFEKLVPGTNKFSVNSGSNTIKEVTFINWDIPFNNSKKQEMVSLSSFFNSKVTDVFHQKYLSPRPQTVTLQLPVNGIGNWCYPNVSVKLDDSGLREKAKSNGEIVTPEGITFKTPSDVNSKNIIFTSQWDNFPKSVSIPLNGKASHIYFMLAGTTNPMQSRIVNGEIEVNYTDGTSEILQLKNPENWWPIEQDYFVDGLAFTTDAPKPPRVYLKSGEISRTFKDFTTIKGYSSFGIDGGAGTILDLPLNKNKTLKSLTIKAIANDVVIGLMSATLIR
ncbi:MAG TPA: glycogen debranching protein, partial [Flavobacterium sp.]